MIQIFRQAQHNLARSEYKDQQLQLNIKAFQQSVNENIAERQHFLLLHGDRKRPRLKYQHAHLQIK